MSSRFSLKSAVIIKIEKNGGGPGSRNVHFDTSFKNLLMAYIGAFLSLSQFACFSSYLFSLLSSYVDLALIGNHVGAKSSDSDILRANSSKRDCRRASSLWRPLLVRQSS